MARSRTCRLDDSSHDLAPSPIQPFPLVAAGTRGLPPLGGLWRRRYRHSFSYPKGTRGLWA
ncbi:hypothetical protein E2562_036172 [Oryza meyeriana var. granulata]|uniref:Uncharacterized protein n=1 Tax=Oryza meyeriana var. granulata TaxID=110450 RepID=A0A6G1CX71_9ORYZ|nr:hypothetical protein E2562_036172 [Oryza meyeriana var. granulata]